MKHHAMNVLQNTHLCHLVPG